MPAESQSLVKGMLRSSPLYVRIRRWQREGFVKAASRYALWRKILASPPVRTLSPDDYDRVQVHTLCYLRDHLTAIWALKTFYNHLQVKYPLAIHISGSIPAYVHRRLTHHFPDAQILRYEDTTPEVHSALKAQYPRLVSWRDSSPFMMKLVDFNLFNRGRVMVALDSDLLFFRHPAQIVTAIDEAEQLGKFTVQRDVASTYNIDPVRAWEKWSIALPERVNTGVIVCRTGSIDFADCEKWLSDPEVARDTGWIEQTMYAMAASKDISFLPGDYLVSREEGLDLRKLTMRHYAGDTRHLLTAEGMPYVLRSPLLNR